MKWKGMKWLDIDVKIFKVNKYKKSDKIVVGFCFVFDWKRKWCELFGLIMESNEE